MTVWVLVYGRWDDVLGTAVFSTPEKAEAYRLELTKHSQYWCDVVEMHVDAECEK